ncbi:MAG: M24 family metallopeptidase [Pseudomonadota bacterium]
MPFHRTLLAAAGLVALSVASGPQSLAAQTSQATAASATEAIAPLPLRQRAEVIDANLAHRLDTLIPRLMREEGVDMWLLMSREYFEDPVTASMLDGKSMSARRRTILVFFDPGDDQPIERLTVSRYGLAGLFEPSWDPAKQPDQWQAVADIIAARDPKSIAINVSSASRFADGMTHSQFLEFSDKLPQTYVERLTSGETLSTRWLETRTAMEMEQYPRIAALAHAIIGEALSSKVITPGVTTCADVQWWYRERLKELGLKPWFHPSIGVQREGAKGILDGDTVIMPGDLVWTDFGITYLRLNTDTQHLAYVLKEGETEAPAGLRQGLANSNRVQDILTSNYKVGLSGNEVLAAARKQAIAEGFDPSIYTHPLGLHGHGAGPSIGFWDNQEPDPRGADTVRANTAWAIELTSYTNVPEWGGQRVDFRTEEDAFFDGETVTYLDGRQTEITLIGAR